MRALLSLALALLLACGGCVQNIARSRVEVALVDAGLHEDQAQCMAQRMVDRLTVEQLRQLEVLKGTGQSPIEFALAVRRIKDPEVVRVTAKAAVVCLSGLDK